MLTARNSASAVSTIDTLRNLVDSYVEHLDFEGILSLAVVDLSPELSDFAETAAAISNLDLVISVDTAVAHLAGALAKPVWTLLPRVPDWRWQVRGETTPWYPTMRLYRQPRSGDWHSVIQRVTGDLASAANPTVGT